MSHETGLVMKLNKPDGTIETDFQSESDAIDHAWACWQKRYHFLFTGWTEDEKKDELVDWKEGRLPDGYSISYATTQISIK